MGILSSEMGFTRFVQNGRVCLVNFGSDTGKLVTIVDVVDQNRAVVYGPTSGVPRLNLTDIKIDIGRGCKAKVVDAAWKACDVEGKWAASSWGKKEAARKAKASANDFDRFKAMVGHKKHMVRARKAMSTA